MGAEKSKGAGLCDFKPTSGMKIRGWDMFLRKH